MPGELGTGHISILTTLSAFVALGAVNAFDLKPFQGYSQGRCGSQG